MNESNSTNDFGVENETKKSDTDNHIATQFIQTFVEIDEEVSETMLPNTQIIHHHDSKCFITEVFFHGIKFILQKRVHNESPNLIPVKRFESISSADDASLDDGVSSLQFSVGSDRGRMISSGTSSEGFHEQERPLIIESHLDNVLCRISSNIRNSICNSCISLPKLSKAFYLSLENVLIYFQDKYHSCQWLSNSASQLNKTDLNEAREELCKVYDAMFNEKINWGRIVAMIGFVGELSVCALSADRLELIEEYISASVCYVNNHVMTWITDHGGWEGLIDFQTGQTYDGSDLDNLFGNLGRLAGVAALALAGVVICKFVSNHI